MTRSHSLSGWVLNLSVILAIVASVFASFIAAHAQQADSIALSMSPQLINVSANAGDAPIENVIRITNGSDMPVELETIPKNITPVGEEGEVDLTEDATSYSLAEWLTVSPSKVTLSPKSTEDFTVTITVPTNAEPGGHFGSVVFKTIPPQTTDGAGAAVSQEIAPVILVSVAGDITEEANIASFASSKSFWTNQKPITFDTRIENTGNVHFQPKNGFITIKNMFGKEVTKIPLDQKNVLPDSIRKITSEWADPGFAIGRYTADLSFVFGEGDEILTASTTFIVFPYQTVIPATLIVVGSLFVLVKFRKRIGAAVKVLSGKN